MDDNTEPAAAIVIDGEEEEISSSSSSDSGSDSDIDFSDDEPVSEPAGPSESVGVKTEPVDDTIDMANNSATPSLGMTMRRRHAKLRMASTSSSVASTEEMTREELKQAYLTKVHNANYPNAGSSGMVIPNRKRTRSNQENEPPGNFIDDDDDDDDINKRVKKRMAKKPRRRTALDAHHDLFDDDAAMKGEPGSEHSDYTRPGQELMGCAHLTKVKLQEILQEVSTEAEKWNNIRGKITIEVKSLKVKTGKGSCIVEEKTWLENEVKAKLEIKYEQKLKTIKRRDTISLDPFIDNDCFRIGSLVRFMKSALNEKESTFSFHYLGTVRQKADRIDSQLKDIDVRIAAGFDVWKCFKQFILHEELHAKMEGRVFNTRLTQPKKLKDSFQAAYDQTKYPAKNGKQQWKDKKDMLSARFNYNFDDVTDAEQEVFEASHKKIAQIELRCDGTGYECYAVCGMPCRDREQLDKGMDSDGFCLHCKQKSSRTHTRCGFRIVLIMWSDARNKWSVYVDIDNNKYHRYENCPVTALFSKTFCCKKKRDGKPLKPEHFCSG